MRITVVFVLCLLLVACDQTKPAEQQTAGASFLSACPAFETTGRPPIVQGAECGELLVYENHAAHSGRQIALNVLRLPAVSSAPKSDPLFVIAGGPGQSAVDIAEQLFNVFNEVRKNRDIVFIDQRGTGKSQPLNCSQVEEIDRELDMAQQKIALLDGLRACVAEHGDRLEFYTTPYAVQDLDLVRQALGYPQLNLWGVSYGTRVALDYMRRYPAQVRTSILDGVAPVSMALPWSAEADALAALEKIQQQCAALDDCTKRYGDILAKANQVAERLAIAPLDIEIDHPLTRLPYRVNMNHQVFASVIRMALYSRDLARLLPLAIHQAQQDDYQLIVTLMSLAESRGGFVDISLGMHYTILCNEDYPQYRDRAAAAAPGFLRSAQIESFREVCELWPGYSLPENYYDPVTSDLPTLLLSGARDPVTPPRWAETTMQTLTRAKHLVAPGGHHSITRDGCVPQLIALFIHQGAVEQLDVQCVQKILPLSPHFTVDAQLLAELDAQQALQATAEPLQKNNSEVVKPHD